MQKPKIIYFRRIFQLFGLVFLAFIPLFDLFRFDLGNKQFLLLGERFFVQQMYLAVMVFGLLLILLVIFSKIFGRIWCGWLCPQNTWAELGDYLSSTKKKGLKSRSQIAGYLSTVIVVFIMILVFSFVIISFFYDPRVLWKQISSGSINSFVAISVFKLTVFGIANMLVIRHSFCWNICPYAMLQRFLANSSTLRMVFNPATCIDCKKCEQVCTMKLKPRYLDENKDVTNCINCGECIKACNLQAARNNTNSSLSYSFGNNGFETKKVLGLDLKTAFTGITLVLLTIGVAVGFNANQGLDISLKTELREEAKLADGWVENHYVLKLRTTYGHTDPLQLEVIGLGDDVKVVPDIFYPTGQSEETISIMVATRPDALNTPLLTIKLLVSTLESQNKFTHEIRASFYNIAY